jgi:hypothetical protein
VRSATTLRWVTKILDLHKEVSFRNDCVRNSCAIAVLTLPPSAEPVVASIGNFGTENAKVILKIFGCEECSRFRE